MEYEEGVCVHGTYVGGCGIDWMCGWCEDGISLEEYNEIIAREWTARHRETVRRARDLASTLRDDMGRTDEEIADVIAYFVLTDRI